MFYNLSETLFSTYLSCEITQKRLIILRWSFSKSCLEFSALSIDTKVDAF